MPKRKDNIVIHDPSSFDILKAEAVVMSPATPIQELQRFLAKCDKLTEAQRSDIYSILHSSTLKKRAVLRAIYGELVARHNMIAFKQERAGR